MIELGITITRKARDMSVGIFDTETFQVPVDTLAAGKPVEHPKYGGTVLNIISVSPEEIVAEWRDQVLTVKFGETVTSRQAAGRNSHLNEGYTATLEYADFADLDHTLRIVGEVRDYHQRLASIGEFSLPTKIVAQQTQVRENLSQLSRNDVSYYPLYALLAASDNWFTLEIVRPEQFKEILLEGIDKGCLEPNIDYAWQIMDLAAQHNDPTGFMDDMDRYYDILATATKAGNPVALDIMNQIWEPEQIIEED